MAPRLFGPDGAPGASRVVRVRAGRAAGGGGSRRPPRGRRSAGVRARGRGQARRAAQARRRRSCRRRSPSRGSTSAWTARARSSYEVREGEYIQVIDVRGRQCSDFLAFHKQKLEKRSRARHGRRDHAHADGRRLPAARASTRKFFDVDMDPLVQVVRDTVGRHDTFGLACTRPLLRGHGLPRPRELHGQLQRAGHAVRDRRARRLGGRQLLLQHARRRRQRDRLRRAVVAPRRLRADAGDDRPRVRVVRVPRRHRPGQRLGHHRHPRARLLAREPLLDGHRPPRDPGGRASADQGNGVPPAYERAHRELRGVPRLLAAPVLQHRGRDQPVLGVPREGRDHGPLAAAQVGGARPGRRGADPDGDHARRAPAGGRAGGLHGGLQRDRRHDRRRHRLPARRQQLPLHRRRPVHGRVAEGAGASGST